jgi:hypothetical protein
MAVDERIPGTAAEADLVSQHATEQEPRFTGIRKKLELPASFAGRYQRRGYLDSGGMGTSSPPSTRSSAAA